MTKPLYAAGQMVRIAHRSLSGPRTDFSFEIAGRYLTERGPAMYHVRSVSDAGERMVPEHELWALPVGRSMDLRVAA